MNLPFYTIGHSTHTIEEFIILLQTCEIELVIDIRTVPKSRTNPQYNKEELPASLLAFGLEYIYINELGGFRNKSKTIAPVVNGFWRNDSFHNYADYALSEKFRSGLDSLINLGRKQRCVMMCSEAVWWRCHRRIVTDYLLARGELVFHLIGAKVEQASLTKGAQIISIEQVLYPETEHLS